MFRSLDPPQGATLFLAKVASKTFRKFLYINRVLWQHVVLCKIALLGMRPAMVYVVFYVVRDCLSLYFDVLLTVHLSIFISVINQLNAQNFCFTISLFHASTCFEDICSSSGGQNCITQPLVSSHV